MSRSNRLIIASLSFLLVLGVSFSSFAGGAFYSKNGRPYTWKNGEVTFKYDSGKLSSKITALPSADRKEYCEGLFSANEDPCEIMNDCGAVACVESLFKKWANAQMLTGDVNETKVPVVDLKIKNGGVMASNVNINANNYNEYENLAAKQNVVIVIFDEDGSIIEKEARKSCDGDSSCLATADENKQKVLGLSEPFKDESTGYFRGGVIIYNGLWLNKDSSTTDHDPEDIDATLFAASMLHEIGHSLGLDHALPKEDAADDEIPTMYPKLMDNEGITQYSLGIDDVVSIATLYPSENFSTKFCSIFGDVTKKDNTRVQGVNVVAYAYTDGSSDYSDQRTFVSGSYYPANTDNGHYILNGIMPCQQYKVIIEAVPDEFQNWEYGLNPYGDDTMVGYDESDIPNAIFLTINNNETDIVKCNPDKMCDAGSLKADYTLPTSGKYIHMDNSPALADVSDDDEEEGSGTTKKGWCMSLAGGFAPEFGYGIVALIAAGLALRRRMGKR